MSTLQPHAYSTNADQAAWQSYCAQQQVQQQHLQQQQQQQQHAQTAKVTGHAADQQPQDTVGLLTPGPLLPLARGNEWVCRRCNVGFELPEHFVLHEWRHCATIRRAELLERGIAADWQDATQTSVVFQPKLPGAAPPISHVYRRRESDGEGQPHQTQRQQLHGTTQQHIQRLMAAQEHHQQQQQQQQPADVSHRSRPTRAELDSKTSACSFCGKVFMSHSAMSGHLASCKVRKKERLQKPILCQCGQAFWTVYDKETHARNCTFTGEGRVGVSAIESLAKMQQMTMQYPSAKPIRPHI
jgi:hypothetical protein